MDPHHHYFTVFTVWWPYCTSVLGPPQHWCWFSAFHCVCQICSMVTFCTCVVPITIEENSLHNTLHCDLFALQLWVTTNIGIHLLRSLRLLHWDLFAPMDGFAPPTKCNVVWPSEHKPHRFQLITSVPTTSLKSVIEVKQIWPLNSLRLRHLFLVTNQFSTTVADPGFPRWQSANSWIWNEKLIISTIFAENGMNMKDIGPEGNKHPESHNLPTRPPLRLPTTAPPHADPAMHFASLWATDL